MELASVVETHISVLVFLGDEVVKLRKPVRTPFLDFSTRELRRADCWREVELNRRLAPDVYLGVLDVVDDGVPVEHLVRMRRLPDARRLSTLVASQQFDVADLVAVARALAVFHARAERSAQIDRAGSPEHLRMLWSTNLAETGPFRGRYLDADVHDDVARRALEYLDGRGPLLAERVAAGRIVDGHGDLLAEDIFCLDDGPRILDCIEFDATFRWGDVLYDTGFLAMDLEHLGRGDLARAFLDAYREFSAEIHPRSLEHWYVGYRALVRAKIACLRAAGGDPDAEGEASRFLAQCASHLRQAQVHLVLVGGLPGTGKSTICAGLGQARGWDVLRSDEVRREQAGLVGSQHAFAPPFEGPYAPEASAAVYAELLRRARIGLERGESLVLDASWLDPEQREAARAIGRGCHASVHELCCVLDVGKADRRIRTRLAQGRDPSDATPQVLAALAGRARVPWQGASAVDTSGSRSDSLARALAALAERDDPGSST